MHLDAFALYSILHLMVFSLRSNVSELSQVFGWEWEGELYRLFLERSFLRTMVARRDPMTLGVHGAEAVRACEVRRGPRHPYSCRAAAGGEGRAKFPSLGFCRRYSLATHDGPPLHSLV